MSAEGFARIETAELRNELETMRSTLHRERRQEKEREVKRQADLSEARQASAEARKERDSTKRIWGEKVALMKLEAERDRLQGEARLSAIQTELENSKRATCHAREPNSGWREQEVEARGSRVREIGSLATRDDGRVEPSS